MLTLKDKLSDIKCKHNELDISVRIGLEKVPNFEEIDEETKELKKELEMVFKDVTLDE